MPTKRDMILSQEDLQKVRAQFLSGKLTDEQLSGRWGRARGWIKKLADRQGWRRPKKRKRTYWAYNTPAEVKSGERDPHGLYGGTRRLSGAEFQYWKQFYEARDAALRARDLAGL